MSMDSNSTLYILGAGAVGMPLAAFLTQVGKKVVAVRTSRKDIPHNTVNITVQNTTAQTTVSVETISLAQLTHLSGPIIITAKAQANPALALELKNKTLTGPIIILQNGLGVERPFREANFAPLYRCVLYVTGQTSAENVFSFRPITASPIGVIEGDNAYLEECVAALTTPNFPFRPEPNIQREIWKKVIINSVFNSICPLLEVDNGVFVRSETAANLAQEVVQECVALTEQLDLGLNASELMEQILRISHSSNGQLISTLQDIRHGRQTEIEFLNLEIARVAANQQPRLSLPKTEWLGKLIVAKSLLTRTP